MYYIKCRHVLNIICIIHIRIPLLSYILLILSFAKSYYLPTLRRSKPNLCDTWGITHSTEGLSEPFKYHYPPDESRWQARIILLSSVTRSILIDSDNILMVTWNFIILINIQNSNVKENNCNMNWKNSIYQIYSNWRLITNSFDRIKIYFPLL